MYSELMDGLKSGKIIPYLGAGAVTDVTNVDDHTPMPADSDSLILAMNNGQPMAPRLMYEFPRAAMNLENKKGRSFITRFLNDTYLTKKWTQAKLHRWLADINPGWIIDINRDTQLIDLYRDRQHILIQGLSRVAGTDFRYKLFNYDGENYTEIDQSKVMAGLPILFKPLGSPVPEANYIASDADFVDYITELMGGFAVPEFLKLYRQNKQYLFLGMRFTRPGNSRWKKALTRKRPQSRTMAKLDSRLLRNSWRRSGSIALSSNKATSFSVSLSPCGRNSPSTRNKIGAPTVM